MSNDRRNPFLLPGSDHLQYTSAADRLHAVQGFTLQQCVDAINLPVVLQKTVLAALRRRMGSLKAELIVESYFNLKDLEQWVTSKHCNMDMLQEKLKVEIRPRAIKIIKAEIARREEASVS